ncbi:uncharacterized protein ACN2A1_010932 [Glossina fuscipes fuscipes]
MLDDHTSPQPFNLYHAQHEVTQSPHSPLSPCCNYNQPSPYGVVSTTTALPIIPQVIGQYKTSPNSAGATCRPSPNSLHEYNVFNQQTQHTSSNFTGTSQWESKFSPNIINNNETIGNDATQFRIYNALTAGLSNANANRTDGNCVETVPPANWPLPPVNLYAQMQHYQANPVVVPPCNVEQMQTNNNNNQNNHNNSEQGLSNLLNFDSTQLVRIDTEDQQMLQLNTEDLQISNLSIST